MIVLNIEDITLNLRQTEGRTTVFDPVRRKWIVLTPEEHVRQYLLQYLIVTMQYPLSLLAVERSIDVGGMLKRFDVVVYGRDHKPWLLAECKRPDVPIEEKTLHQLLNYQQVIKSRYWLLTNGYSTFCADAVDANRIEWLGTLPAYEK